MSKVKKIIPGTTVLISSYFSVLFALGLIIGYLATLIFHKKFVNTGKVRLVYLNFGKKWQVHLHHWLIGVLAFYLIGITGLFFVFPKLFLGAIGGMIFHDLYFDKKWYKIILKKSDN